LASALWVAILALGAGVSRLGLRSDVDRNQKADRERMAKLAAMDYVPVERSLQFAVPANIASGEKIAVVCWARGEKLWRKNGNAGLFDITGLGVVR
jgi:hypothetical protein